MEKNSQTQFIEDVSKKGGFTSAKNVTDRGALETVSLTGDSLVNDEGNYGWVKHVPKLFETLEDRFPFTAVLVGIIGYIVIASFGHLEDFGSYLRYSVFLVVAFVLYKILYLQKIELRQIEKINKATLIGFIILVFIIFFTYFDKLIVVIKSFVK